MYSMTKQTIETDRQLILTVAETSTHNIKNFVQTDNVHATVD